jgi:hypothetical protein
VELCSGVNESLYKCMGMITAAFAIRTMIDGKRDGSKCEKN